MFKVGFIYRSDVFASEDPNFELPCYWISRRELCACCNEVGERLIDDLISINPFGDF